MTERERIEFYRTCSARLGIDMDAALAAAEKRLRRADDLKRQRLARMRYWRPFPRLGDARW